MTERLSAEEIVRLQMWFTRKSDKSLRLDAQRRAVEYMLVMHHAIRVMQEADKKAMDPDRFAAVVQPILRELGT